MSQNNYSSKSYSREYAFKFLYKLSLKEFAAEKNDLVTDSILLDQTIAEFDESYIVKDEEHSDNELSTSIQNYGRTLISGCLTKENEIVEKLSPLIKKRSFASIDTIERSILLVAAYELMFTETPKKVVINEFLNINDKFGQKETNSFLNGILDKVQ